jgi:uncharacterized damage-inducible protein DinB
MKGKFLVLAVTARLLSTTTAVAQGSAPSAIRSAVDSWITTTEREFVPAADALPAEKFDFAPATAIGEFAGVRTFGQQVKHVAANNYGMASLILGRERTAEMADEAGPDSVQTKAQIMAYVRGSFRALHDAVATIDDANAVSPIKSPSNWQKTRLSFAIDAVTHSYDHYGQLVEYLRMNGIVPPASRPSSRP